MDDVGDRMTWWLKVGCVLGVLACVVGTSGCDGSSDAADAWAPGASGAAGGAGVPVMGTGGVGVQPMPPGEGTQSGTGGFMAGGGGAMAVGVPAGGGAAAGSEGDAEGQPGPGASPGPGCDGVDYLLCEDFESTAAGAVPAGWTQHGDASVAEDQAAHGVRALKIGAAANGARRIETDASVLGSRHWGRVYYRVQLPVPNVFVHSTLVALQGQGPTRGNGEYRVVDTVKQAGGAHQFLYNVQPSGAEFGTGSSYDWAFDDAWHCAEWYIDADAQAYRFFIDGAEVESIRKDNGGGNYSGTDIPPVFDSVKVGWNNYQYAGEGFVAWMDDVAMDDERVGCIE